MNDFVVQSGKNYLGVIELEESNLADEKAISSNAKRPSIPMRSESPELFEEDRVLLSEYHIKPGELSSKTASSEMTKKGELKAAAHNDNEEYPFYLDYLNRYSPRNGGYFCNVRDRIIIRFVDTSNKPVWNVPYQIESKMGIVLWQGNTYSNGENVYFPYAFDLRDQTQVQRNRKPLISEKPVYVVYNSGADKVKLDLTHNRVTTINYSPDQPSKTLSMDILFILDATGSMADEIQQLKDNLYSIHTRIMNSLVDVPIRFGLVSYRDRGDTYVTKVEQFTDDLNEFQNILDKIEAGGGGDFPEDIQSALDDAIHKMKWNSDAIKLSFLVADAPPHIDYDQEYTYIDATLEANRKGIKLYTIGASGLPPVGEYIFRQISVMTYSEFIFLTYGETGESDGFTGPGKVSHHTGSNYSSRALDDLVVDIIRKEASYQLPEDYIVHEDIEPETQESYLKLRMDNLWAQIYKQIDETSKEPPVGIIPVFQSNKPELDDIAGYLQNLSIDLVVESEQIDLVERNRLEEILKEHGLSMAGIIQDGEYGEIGKLTKADIIFFGNVDYAGMDRVVMVRGVQLKDSRIIAAARVRI